MCDDRGMRLKLNQNILFIWNKNKTLEKMKTNQNNIVYLEKELKHDKNLQECIFSHNKHEGAFVHNVYWDWKVSMTVSQLPVL